MVKKARKTGWTNQNLCVTERRLPAAQTRIRVVSSFPFLCFLLILFFFEDVAYAVLPRPWVLQWLVESAF